VGRRDKERKARIEAGLEQPRSVTNIVTEGLVRRVESFGNNKEGAINKLVGNWKKDMRKQIKKQGIGYLTEFNLEKEFKENLQTIESNHMVKQLVMFLRITNDEIKEAMIKTLAEMKEEYGVTDEASAV
jgi:hypothetical protein